MLPSSTLKTKIRDCFLKVAQSFIINVYKELEALDRDSTAVAKCKMPDKGRNTIWTSKFILKMQKSVDKYPRIVKKLKVSRHSIERIGHEDIWYKSCDREANSCLQNQHLVCVKLGMLCFFTDKKNFDQNQKVNPEGITDVYAKILKIFPWSCIQSFLATVIVLGVVSNEGSVLPPHFFPRSLCGNTVDY